MKQYIQRSLSTACALVSLNALAFDFEAKTLQAYDCEQCANLSKASLGRHWPTDGSSIKTSVINTRTSYSYRIKTNVSTLANQGLRLNIIGPQAVIRIHAKNLTNLRGHLQLEDGQGKLLNVAALTLPNPTPKVNTTPWQTQNSLFLQLPESAGKGSYRLRLPKQANNGSQNIYIQVLDKQSYVGMSIETDKVFYQHGDTLRANINIDALRGRHLPLHEVNAYLRNDENENIALEVHDSKSGVWVEYPFTELRNSQGAPWYLMVEAMADIDDMSVKRDAHAAISYTIPSATALSVTRNNRIESAIDIKVKTSVASRYQIQAVLYQKNSNGTMKAIEISEQTVYAQPGEYTVTLEYDSKLKNSTRYAVGDIKIIDYGQMQRVFVYNKRIPMQRL